MTPAWGNPIEPHTTFSRDFMNKTAADDSSDEDSRDGDARETTDNSVGDWAAGDKASVTESMPLPLSTASLVGSRLAGYLILSRLGRGGMADVYAARDMALERDVAIKVLRPDLARDRDYITRFRREAKAAAKLNHSNIVQIYEVGEDASRHYIAQELISGQNLREYLERNGTVGPEQAIEILYGVASALDAAAIEGITHRDIKPENIMWSKAGSVKVADFGLARLGDDVDGSRADLTQAGLTLGTPRYMSPEQVQGRPVDPRSDLYSLGVTMYHLLSGRPPFEADDPLALAFAHVNETPKPLDRVRGDKDVPEWLIAIIAKLLRKDPAERFQSPGELLDALTGDDATQRSNTRRLAGAATATARLQRVADEEKRNRARRRKRMIALSLVPILAVGLGIATASQVKRPAVADLLRPDRVPQRGSIEEQYLEAAERDDVQGWKAIETYFPPGDSAVMQAYVSKAKLQLARLYLEQDRIAEAEATLVELLNNPTTDRKYRLIALARRVQAAKQTGDKLRVDEAKRQLKAAYSDIKSSNAAAITLFEAVFSGRERLELGIDPAPSE
ncbi:serine/threonine protein kinase [Rhodopirellula sp. SM50]|nr:serine/threonine protein kinase [Rhodopirellula sp. SM50]